MKLKVTAILNGLRRPGETRTISKSFDVGAVPRVGDWVEFDGVELQREVEEIVMNVDRGHWFATITVDADEFEQLKDAGWS